MLSIAVKIVLESIFFFKEVHYTFLFISVEYCIVKQMVVLLQPYFFRKLTPANSNDCP